MKSRVAWLSASHDTDMSSVETQNKEQLTRQNKFGVHSSAIDLAVISMAW